MQLVLRIKKEDSRLLHIGLYVILNQICLMQYSSASLLAVLLTFGTIILAFFVPYPSLGIYLFACLPFFNVMNYRIGSTSLFYLLIAVVLLRYLIQGYEKNTPFRIVVFLLIVLITFYNILAAKLYLRWAISLLPLIFLFRTSLIKDQLNDIIDKYCISMLFASLWGLLMLYNGRSIYTGSYVVAGGVLTTRFAGLVGDSVLYGIQLVFLISFLLIQLCKNDKNRIGRLFLIMLFCIFGTITYAKTFIVCALFEFIYIYVYWSKRQKLSPQTLLRKLILFLSLIAVFAVFLDLIATSNLQWAENIRARFSVIDLSTGRVAGWKYYIDHYLNTWVCLFKGIGFSEYVKPRTVYPTGGEPYVVQYTHNLYLETAIIFGVIETVVLLILLVLWIVKVFGESKDTIYFLPLAILLITGMFSHGHLEYSFYLNLLLILSTAEFGSNICSCGPAYEKENEAYPIKVLARRKLT